MSLIRIMCPFCKRTGTVPPQALGKTVKCPACGNRYTLTEAPPVPPPVADDVIPLEEEPPPPPARPVQRFPQPQPAPVSARDERTLPLQPILIGAGGVVGVLILGVVAFAFWPRGQAADETASASAGSDERSFAPVSFNPVAPPANEAPTPSNDSVASHPANNPPAAGPANPAPPAEDEPVAALPTAEIVARSEASVALVKGKVSSGTGFLVGPGLLATNSHVIDDEFMGGIEVRFPSADESLSGPFPAELLYEDAQRDLAFLSVNTSLPALNVAKSYKYRKGEDITTIGNPGDGPDQVLENAISRGVMSTRAKVDGRDFYQLNISVNPGNSGGPVFDSGGRVIGVITLKSVDKEGVAFCIPLDDLRAGMSRASSQSQDDISQTRSKHRLRSAFKTLVQGAALYVVGIFVRRKYAGAPPSKDGEDGPGKFEKLIEELDERLFSSLPGEMAAISSDLLVPKETRRKLDLLSKNFSKLKAAYGAGGRPTISDQELNSLRGNQLAIAKDLSKALDIEFPQSLLLVLEPRQQANPDESFRNTPGVSILRPPSLRRMPSGPRRPGLPSPGSRLPRSRLRQRDR